MATQLIRLEDFPGDFWNAIPFFASLVMYSQRYHHRVQSNGRSRVRWKSHHGSQLHAVPGTGKELSPKAVSPVSIILTSTNCHLPCLPGLPSFPRCNPFWETLSECDQGLWRCFHVEDDRHALQSPALTFLSLPIRITSCPWHRTIPSSTPDFWKTRGFRGV